jgi:hypothetical protein
MKSKGTSFTQKQKNILATLGENIKLARLRRKLSIRSMAEASRRCYIYVGKYRRWFSNSFTG